jgi:hypothetical protein
MIHQHEIEAQIQKAMETKMRFRHCGLEVPSVAVSINHYRDGGRGLGFFFTDQHNIGDWINCADGMRQQVVAIVK